MPLLLNAWSVFIAFVVLVVLPLIVLPPVIGGTSVTQDQYWSKFWAGLASSAAAASTIGLFISLWQFGLQRSHQRQQEREQAGQRRRDLLRTIREELSYNQERIKNRRAISVNRFEQDPPFS